MLVEQFNFLVAVPFRVVVAPCHHIAYEVHFGIFCQYGILEFPVALVVAVALLCGVVLVVFVANLQVFDVERFGMSVCGTHCSKL